MTQAEFGEKYHLGSQSMVWQYLHGRAPLNLDAAKKFAAGLNVSLSEISPTLSELHARGGGEMEPRTNVTMQLKPSLKGGMLRIYADHKSAGSNVKLYEIYEDAIAEYIARYGET